MATDKAQERPSVKEFARQRRHEAYEQAKARLKADPRYLAYKVAEKERRRDAYAKVKAKKKAAKDAERAERRAAVMCAIAERRAALMGTMVRASALKGREHAGAMIQP